MKSAALRRFYEATGFTVMRAAVLINIAALLGIIGLIVVNAWPAMTWEFLTRHSALHYRHILPGAGCFGHRSPARRGQCGVPQGIQSAVRLGDVDASFDC